MIKVLNSGFYATIQDRGRVGFAAKGIPVSGAMDQYSSAMANSILNNSDNAAVLEITFGGCKLQFLAATIICISGADFSAKINNEAIILNSRIQVQENDVLSFGKINFGVRTYLAVKDGFKSDKIWRSRSFYPQITNDFIIRKNDLLPITTFKSDLESSNTSVKTVKSHFDSNEINCFKGPEFELLNKHQHKRLLQESFTISNDNNRMGYRLTEIIKNSLPSILTSAVLPGTVQLTPSGKLIILMKDCQVTGGYPRILQLTENAIYKLAQKTTNQFIRFRL
ncbi:MULTISPECIES: biotin-dependent carboxyltransferase family protein [unclassified Polaribacter]|uniref:5-oxoprolinase subunit C family protein n=1 Tax=unclassified Polaribacter TaxID=196858 RepID=UPI0011BE2C9F|nr:MULTISPECIES: biotin-dependent carboxyltransferase family protein [unclassified Polaribacter]TXD50922.1 biotin-dependent carboxyltransferase family protein [Polaribacter sp. IC063]TXD62285.1 biotin-dependent carboxyltransferase family protein [Polaribacter sp. IC066]